MADTKISDLTAGTTIVGTEPIPMVQGGATVRTTPTAITLSLSTATSTGLSTATSSITSLSTGLSTTNSTAVVLSTSTSTGLSTAVSTGASLSTAVAGKQATLVSATNIKTINSNSLLGAGDLVVSAAPGGSTTEVQFNDAGSLAGDSALTWDKTNNVLAIAQGTLTTSQPQTHTVTWNDGAVTFIAQDLNVTDTASASGSLLQRWRVGGSSVAEIRKSGVMAITGQLQCNTITWVTGFGADSQYVYAPSYAFCTASNYQTDAVLSRIGTGVIGVVGSGGGATVQFTEQTAPAAGASNTVRIYAQDNGAGKTQLMAKFASGAAQQIAIEP